METISENDCEDSFANVLLKVLKMTDYEGASLYEEPSHFQQLNFYGSCKDVQPFVDWFSKCITQDNCITRKELNIYKRLEKAGDLVPEKDLDNIIETFCCPTSSIGHMFDLEPLLDFTRKKIESLELLEKKSKKIEEKKKFFGMDLSEAVSNELVELNNLNEEFNAVLDNFSIAWHYMKSSLAQKQQESKSVSEVIIKKINTLNHDIEKNINFHLSNDFKEVKCTEGIIHVSPEEYYSIFKRLKEVKNAIITLTSKQEGISIFSKQLSKFETILNNTDECLSFEEIRDLLIGKEPQSKLLNSLSELLKNEKNCLGSLQLKDTLACNDHFEARLDHLSKIEKILTEKNVYNEAFIFLTKRNQLLIDFQLLKLQEFLKRLDLYYKSFEERKNLMAHYKHRKLDNVDQNYISMMNEIDVKVMNLKALDDEIGELYRNISEINDDIDKALATFQSEVLSRLNVSAENDKILFDGPTRELFDQVTENKLIPLKSFMESIQLFQKKTNKINEMLCQGSKKECIWLECLKDPKMFLIKLEDMTSKFNALQKEYEYRNTLLNTFN